MDQLVFLLKIESFQELRHHVVPLLNTESDLVQRAAVQEVPYSDYRLLSLVDDRALQQVHYYVPDVILDDFLNDFGAVCAQIGQNPKHLFGQQCDLLEKHCVEAAKDPQVNQRSNRHLVGLALQD